MKQKPFATTPLAHLHIAILMGGISAEREVSLVSGKACADALRLSGAKVSLVDAGRDLATVLADLKPDVALNCLHGEWGEDGAVQGILETLEIPYTHSGVGASALAMDKTKAKIILKAAGVPVPEGGLFPRGDIAAHHVLKPPYVVKPNAEGSSVGVIRVMDGANRPPAEVLETGAPEDLLLVEPYIAGRELTAAVLEGEEGPRALAVTEIIAATGFYDYTAKYSEGGSRHVVPAEIPADVTERALRLAERAHAALGCRGLSRTDFRFDADGAGLVALEVNTQPGMTPLSLAPEQAAYKNITFAALVEWLVRDADLRR